MIRHKNKLTLSLVTLAILSGCATVTPDVEKTKEKEPSQIPQVEIHKEDIPKIEPKKEDNAEIVAFENRVKAYTGSDTFTYKDKQYVMMDLDKTPYDDAVIEAVNTDDILILVNKYNGLLVNYQPSDLIAVPSSGEHETLMRKEAGEAFINLVDWANTQGIQLNACSTFRTAQYQGQLWSNGKANGGLEYADKWWTRAGFSEHQTGLAVDIRLFNDFSDLDAVRNYPKEYNLLMDHIADYGFILRYPEDKKDITLIEPESWHLRYVGKDVAKEIKSKDITYEQYVADKKLEELYKDFPSELERG